MNTEERLVKAKIKLQSRSPFFSYLALYVKFKKVDENALGGTYTMGVSPNGTLHYNDKWIETLTDEEIIGVLCHEILHLSLLHLLRRGNREHEKWNIAVDLAVNKILIDDGFELPKGGLIPDRYDEFKFPSHLLKSGKPFTLKELKGKTGEMIYEEIPELKSQKGGTIYVSGFDKHSEEQEGKGKGKGKGEGDKVGVRELTGTEKAELENEWLNRLEEAYVSAKQRGNVPAGIERYIEEIKKSQINWKALLQKYVQALIPNDFTWLKRSKRSVATGIYLPNVKKEKIDVCVGIDLSGSIGKEELTEFLSEIIGLAKAYQSAITMRLLTHDVDVHNDYVIANGNIAKIKALKLKGGGGTSHKPIFNYVKEKVKDCRAVIFFTDGYSDLEDIEFSKYNFNKIFVINKFGDDECVKDRSDCISIKMKKNGK